MAELKSLMTVWLYHTRAWPNGDLYFDHYVIWHLTWYIHCWDEPSQNCWPSYNQMKP
jgi:hypothetical protein